MSEFQGWLAIVLGIVTLLTVVVQLHGGFRDLREELRVFIATVEQRFSNIEKQLDTHDEIDHQIVKKVDEHTEFLARIEGKFGK